MLSQQIACNSSQVDSGMSFPKDIDRAPAYQGVLLFFLKQFGLGVEPQTLGSIYEAWVLCILFWVLLHGKEHLFIDMSELDIISSNLVCPVFELFSSPTITFRES